MPLSPLSGSPHQRCLLVRVVLASTLMFRTAGPPAASTSDRDVARAEGCLRALLAWVGAPSTPRRSTAVAKIVNELLDNDPTTVYAAMRRLAFATVPSDVLSERYQLTKREMDVVRLLALGKSNADVAATLSISEHTARRHTEQVLSKLGVRSRAAVAPLFAELAAETTGRVQRPSSPSRAP